MAHNQRVRPPGLWTASSVLLAAEVEQLDQAQFLELHEGGGTWAIQSDVTIGGVGASTWRFTAPLVVSDLSGHVIKGKMLAVDAQGTLAVDGVVDLRTGAVQNVEPGALLAVRAASGTSFGTVQFDVGALLGLAGSMLVSDFGKPSPAGTITLGTGIFGFGHIVVTQWGDVTFKSQSNLVFEAASPFATISGYARWVAPGGPILEGTTNMNGTMIFGGSSSTRFAQGAVIDFRSGTTVNFAPATPPTTITGLATWQGPGGVILEGASEVHGSLAFSATGRLDCVAGSAITGRPKLAAGATLTLDTGSQVDNAAATTRTGPEDRSGGGAVTGHRKTTGPNKDWTVDGEAWDWIVIPPQNADRIWKLAAPKNQQRAIEFTMTALTPALNASVQVVFGSTPLCKFTDSPNRWAGSVKFGWDPDLKQWLIKDCTMTGIVGGAGSALSIPT